MPAIDAVIKVGGSLAESDVLPSLCHQISELARKHHLLVVPGGGPFADRVRRSYLRWRLNETTAHKMALLAMDQYGYLLCDLIPNSLPSTSFAEVESARGEAQVFVLIPSPLLFHLDPLPHSWTVTSDSIAAWVAAGLNARTLVLLKAVDGMHRAVGHKELLGEAALDQLAGGEVVDEYLPVILREATVDTWIINGLHPRRLAELFTRGETRGTRVRRARGGFSTGAPSRHQSSR